MPLLKRIAFAAAGFVLFSALPGQQAEVRGQGQTLVWAPMPVQPNEWVAPNKPITRLSELRAKHAGEKNWTETVVSDNLFHGDYISMAPGMKTPRRSYPDNRALVDRAGRANSLFDRRPGAVCRLQRILGS